MADYLGKKIVIIGLGLTGLSCVDFFMARGVIPRVMDTRSTPPGRDKLPDDIECHSGSLNADWLMDADLIVASPGIALTTVELQAAANAGIEIVGDIELFCREATAPIVAITGSNGKSTVTSLVGEMAKAANWQVGVGGNIGLPALELLKKSCQLYVLELSSFQLETTYSLKAAAAAVLNVTEDHMDRYPQGLSQYRAAKLRVYHQAKRCVVNAQDALTLPETGMDSRCISFGVECGDYQLDSENALLKVHNQSLLATNEIKLTGRHNYVNGLAALALADAVGIPRKASLAALKVYPGLDHRFQLVHMKNGVRWINDSKATNVGSTEAALNGLKLDGTLYLLLGGDGKSADFSPLKPFLSGNKVRLYCFGRDGKRLAQLRPEMATLTETMEQAIRDIAPRLVAGDMVLLSPACASLDQFRNFEQRGHEFARLAEELG
ncbi:UDP-N-acetylmuramoyl-L-alanine--D-glutamate ligase [Photorhabdus temperata]|uniref:UDP-N-acetylmuramoylalanine--D-glutamate ligase n=1 Tax=Photorhabdus temperata subsp. temperata Meg1 TaxID=1393735 RepID=A0A081RWU5_PHOTE|nr:UDP-N-acetylmuramoyl-L-alanine--D-glutamate ligase [Photorhabdus temperata]KER03148.1 UDP-N-acetylmuramoylalanine--D-glutamate ligase [Photorhabdus temperata subsp. temperata Meg1]MCT8347541.1 UDP-N-acetylmuramoyl-L-alanine--D-glutamate ligase [Photorhabdus temperata]